MTHPAMDDVVRRGERFELGAEMVLLAVGQMLDARLGELRNPAATAQQEQAPQSSVQIEQAAKPGAPPRITVKCYAPMPGAAADMAGQLYDQLTARYAVGGVEA